MIDTPEFENALREWSREHQTAKRFAHTTRVVETAQKLAEKWLPEEAVICRLAGWIHDAAKELPDKQLLRYALEHHLPISKAEYDTPMLLHGAVAYSMASIEFVFEDERIRTACAYHTTGSPDMNTADKIVYMADLIEPEREFPSVETIRKLAFKVDLDKALFFSIVQTLQYLAQREKPIDPRVVELYNVLIKTGVTLD